MSFGEFALEIGREPNASQRAGLREQGLGVEHDERNPKASWPSKLAKQICKNEARVMGLISAKPMHEFCDCVVDIGASFVYVWPEKMKGRAGQQQSDKIRILEGIG